MTNERQFFKNIVNAIVSLDQFGSMVSLRIKNQDTHKTLVGALTSIGIAALIIYSIVSLMYNMLYMQNATVVSTQQYDPNPKIIKLLADNYLLGITVTDIFGKPIIQDKKSMIYQTQARHCNRQFTASKGFHSNCTNFNLVPCNYAQINPELLQALQIDSNTIEPFYCIDTLEWANSSLSYQGTAISPQLQTMNLFINPCVNNTVIDQVCASPSVINDTLNHGFAAVILPNYLINQKSGGDPYTSSFKLITAPLTNTQLTYMQIYLQPSNTTTIMNYFHYHGSVENKGKLLYNRQEQSFLSIPPEGEIASFTLLLDDQRVDYYRTYYDIFFVLGNIGGLANLLILFGNILIKPLSRLSMDLFLVNQIYTLDGRNKEFKSTKSMDSRQANSQNRQRKSIQFLKQYKSSSPVTSNNLPDLNTNVAWLKQLFKQKISKAKFTIREYIFQCFPGKNALLVKTGVDKIYQKLDSLYIIKKLIEIDKLKVILLNEQQIKLFEQLPKPSLSLKEGKRQYSIVRRSNPHIEVKKGQNDYKADHKEFNIFQRQKPFLEQLQEVYEAYIQISDNPSDLDRKLLSLLDKDIVNIFDQVAKQEVESQRKVKVVHEMEVIENQNFVFDISPIESPKEFHIGTEKENLDEMIKEEKNIVRSYKSKRNKQLDIT